MSMILRTFSSFPLAVFPSLLERLLPGFTLVAIVTAAAYGLRQLPVLSGVSPMFSAILIGMAFANFTSVPVQAAPGVSLLGKKMLRVAVALLGLQVTLTQIFEVGLSGMLAISFIVLATYSFTLSLHGLWGLKPPWPGCLQRVRRSVALRRS